MAAAARHLPPLVLLLVTGCGETATTDPAPQYFALVYGTVRQSDLPVSGVEVRGEVYTVGCPASGSRASDQRTRSGLGGAYRLLLVSGSPAAGQCLRVTPAGGTPVAQTLADLPFSATSGAAVEDSARIDLTLP